VNTTKVGSLLVQLIPERSKGAMGRHCVPRDGPAAEKLPSESIEQFLWKEFDR
jgi:hypothetical protein